MCYKVDKNENTRCGIVAVVGRPNVGKSTLVNRLVGEKVTITGPKPHTTRFPVRGVLTVETQQAIFCDTPGSTGLKNSNLHRIMRQSIDNAVLDADVVVVMLTGPKLLPEDERTLAALEDVAVPIVGVVNKVDLVKPKERLLPFLKELTEQREFAAIVPCSAKNGTNLNNLVDEILKRLPAGPLLFPAGVRTDLNSRVRIAEVIREKLMARLHEEVPYGLAVDIEHLDQDKNRWHVHAAIWVEREQHKPIVIGKGGANLKTVGESARREIQSLLNSPGDLELWVKVKGAWSSDPAALRKLGLA